MNWNSFVWLLISGTVTGVMLPMFRIRPSIGTGAVCGAAFLIGVASQHYQLF